MLDNPLLEFATEQLALEPVKLLPEGGDFGFERTDDSIRIRNAGSGIFYFAIRSLHGLYYTFGHRRRPGINQSQSKVKGVKSSNI